MTDSEVDYLIGAVKFVLEHGHKFISQYEFNLKSGEWRHLDYRMPKPLELDIELGFKARSEGVEIIHDAQQRFQDYLDFARQAADQLPEDFELLSFEPELEQLMFFYAHRMTGR